MARPNQPRTVAFVAPYFLDTTVRFISAAAREADARVGLISTDPLAKLPSDVAARLAAHCQVGNALDPEHLTAAVIDIGAVLGGAVLGGATGPVAEGMAGDTSGRGRQAPVDRLLGTLEHLQEPLAIVRDRLGIVGMGHEAARNFRDKARMKTVLRAAGVPCARHRLLTSEEAARDFVREVGFPIVVKPPEGAGAKGTGRLDSLEALVARLRQQPPSRSAPLLAEEFVQGEEHSFDGVSIGGRLVWHSITRYLPTPLEVVENPWIQWCVLLPREVDHPRFNGIRTLAAQALDALGMDTGVSHLEWFRRTDGSLAISEVGARPGGAQISKLISYAHDFDFYRAWAGVVIHDRFTPPARRFAAGAAYLRGQSQRGQSQQGQSQQGQSQHGQYQQGARGGGRVRAIRGLARAQQEVGEWVVESNLPTLGQPPSGSYEGEGYVILRHPETRVVERALARVVSLVRVDLG
jgi:hypothetical protein